uniref:hypothetical protein n=1 Tax=Candidatus Electrothrix sp. TaxID=2170559 RepID=UPI004056F231
MIHRQSFTAALFLFFLLAASSATAGKVTYSYDSNNRLIQAAFSGSSIGWEYDRNDNMQFSTAAKQFPWLLFLPTIIRQGTQTIETTASENKEFLAGEVTEQTGSEKERN